MIEFEAVSRNYGSKQAVRSLSLRIESGELFTLLGHNGAGKTTSIKMLVGLLRAGAGRVLVEGFDVAQDPRRAAQLIGYVPDEPYLYDKLSGREFLTFVAEMHGLAPHEAAAAIGREVERFGLEPFVDDLCESYSHGMKQRTVFASALIHTPRVLIVDEPMVGLDPHSIRLVKDLMREQARGGATVFMSTHTLTAAEEIADRIGVMNRGELLFLGTLDEMRQAGGDADGSLERLYLDMVGAHRPEAESQPTETDAEAAAP
ncbi:putative ABC transporter ATP-binding protein YxlF [Pseudobythopirellula maris]|uniref:Putative ABC transporter ATP-binding protein YxlF n=1 Tax=Pseudobythopirellula maris TaxID=2527991 RepID=A0A5C5ZRB0_9BACT|nr:ABC transporter ATP-binding protein [Pseudobythopirellula maris]TWT90034.1 putative ABC transporter ATP-binding protein YxlF [Pseudobythopirellula maris]